MAPYGRAIRRRTDLLLEFPQFGGLMPNLKSVLHDLQQQRTNLNSEIERNESAVKALSGVSGREAEGEEADGAISRPWLSTHRGCAAGEMEEVGGGAEEIEPRVPTTCLAFATTLRRYLPDRRFRL